MLLGKDTYWDHKSLAETGASLTVGPDNFGCEVVDEERPVLLACSHLCPEFREQKEILQSLSKSYAGALKVCLLDTDCIAAFRETLGIVGTPTFLIFHGGKEKGRMLGRVDREALASFVLRTLPHIKSLCNYSTEVE